jgi:hypothetical protein
MNTGIERRPFKVLRPLKHSTAMVIARYANREARVMLPAPVEPGDLLWKALLVAGLCAACAFSFFLLSERHLIQRSGQTVGSLPYSIERVRLERSRSAARGTDDKTVLAPTEMPGAETPGLAPMVDKRLKVTRFALEVSPEFQDLDGVELRLVGVNAAANTYDITVRTRQREFYRQDVRLDEHVPLAKDPARGPELVVARIGQDRVFGYLSEQMRNGRRRHRRRK